MAAGPVYDLLTALVVPRPIAFVSSLSQDGTRNLAPFSFFMVGGVTPPSLMVCPVLGREGAPKDTLRFIRETGEFVVNLVTRQMAEQMNQTSAYFPPEVDEWQVSGFTPLPSERIKPERVAESPAHFECLLHEIVMHGDESGSAAYVIAEILVAHISEEILEDGRVTGFQPISRLGGADYLDLACGKVFQLPRPKPGAGSS